MTALLEVEGLTVAYGEVVAVRDVSLSVGPGQTLAVLGANGAGKTTTLTAISRLLPARAGSIRVDGHDVTNASPEDVARMGVAHVPAGRGIFPSLTVAENLRMGSYGAGLDGSPEGKAALDEAVEPFPILRERWNQAAGTMSGGQQQMLAIARALAQRPRLLMLDEMSMGLAPAVVEELFGVVADLKERGIAVVLVEQFVSQALAVADAAVVLEQGRVVASGSPEALRGDDVAAAYLGGHGSGTDLEVPPAPAHVTETVGVSLGPREARQVQRLAARRGVPVGELLGGAARRLLDEEDDE